MKTENQETNNLDDQGIKTQKTETKNHGTIMLNEKLIIFGKALFVKMIFCCIVFSPFLTERLVNSHDATWYGADYMGGPWELSIGRFMIGLFDKVNFARHIQPFNLLLTLFICVAATELIAFAFGHSGDNLINYCFSFMFLSNTVITTWLSYSYTSTVYAWGLFFAAVSCAVISRYYTEENLKKRIAYLVCSSGFFALTMGTYQSFLCCILVIMLFFIIYLVCSGEIIKNLFETVQGFILTGILGSIFYEVILHLMLKIRGITIASYNGADSITLNSILSNLPDGIKTCIKDVPLYFSGALFHISMFRYRSAFVVIWVFVIVSIIYLIRNLDNKVIRIILAFGCLCCIPIAALVTKLLAPQSGLELQQTGSYALLVPLVFITLLPQLKKKISGNRKKFIAELGMVLISFVIVWGRTYANLGDQEAMREMIYTRKSICTEIYSAVINQGYAKEGYQLAIVGDPTKSPLFVHEPIYDDANELAAIGWWSVIRAWRGVYRYELGLNLPFVEQDVYEEILGNEQVQQMPSFPNVGSIIEVGDIVVVKVS